MTRWILFAMPLLLTACGDVEDTEEYQAGYEAGFIDGREKGKKEGTAEICDEVYSRLNRGAASAVGC